jgi:hypothetical protein
VIADLSLNFTERQVLLCGYTLERVEHDYGLDRLLFTYDADGYDESGVVFVQVKATDALKLRSGGREIAFRVARMDAELWREETFPVILIVYDAQADVAYWLYVQAYFERLPAHRRELRGQTVTLYIPRTNVLDPQAVRRFRQFKKNVQAQGRGVIRHYE